MKHTNNLYTQNRSDDGQEELIYQNPEQPYQLAYQNSPVQTSQNPFQTSFFPVTTPRFVFSSVSTTRSPYDFNFFPTNKPSPFVSSPDVSRVNPNENFFLGNYFETLRKTTKSPYDFGNFGKTSPSPFVQIFNDNIDNNYLKRSYNVASYYSDSSNLNKSIVNGRLSI